MSHQIANLVMHAVTDVDITVLVQDEAGDPINISNAVEIIWKVVAHPGGPALLTKTFTGSGIAFVTDGSDGLFKVSLVQADTSGIKDIFGAGGFYMHEASFEDASNLVSVVATGVITLDARA